MKLDGKAAIVTGAASGIGRACALRLAGEGAGVVICDLNLDGADSAAAEIRASGGTALPLQVDVAKQAEVEAAVERTLTEYGRIDILVNAAAYLTFTLGQQFHDETDEEWDRHINVTLKGTLRFCRAVIPHMIAQKSGRIINITSDAAKVMQPAGPYLYPGCKAAVAAVSRCLAASLAPHGILVNCVAPGPVRTPSMMSQPDWLLDLVTQGIPLKRLGEPEEVAGLVILLASDEASYITGQHWSVDGGIAIY